MARSRKPRKAAKGPKASEAGAAEGSTGTEAPAHAASGRAGKPGKPAKNGKNGKAGRSSASGRTATDLPVPPTEALAEVPELSELPEPAETPEQPGRPPGQRLYDMPFSSPEPRLVDPEVGLHNVVARAGHNAAYGIEVTLLDAHDHRLIRSGVLLAHRVLDERGEWFLTAPDWQPLLPKDRIEPMGHADLPDDLASLIRPLRRRATLGPVAGLKCERREFALRDDRGTTLALLRDDKVTVRRGGLTTARYREVMLTPVGPGLTTEQRRSVDRAFRAVGANRVPRFPRLVTRLGAPATGASDIPAVQVLEGSLPLKRFVGALVGNRLHAVVRADLALRSGAAASAAALGAEAAALREELAGLEPALEPAWAEDLRDDLDWLLASVAAGPARTAAGEPAWLRSERYLSVLERLVSAARSAHLDVDGTGPAADALARLLEDAVGRLRACADPLRVDSSDGDWDTVREALGVLHGLAVVASTAAPAPSGAALALLRRPARLLAAVPLRRPSTEPDLSGLTPAEAFEAGREHERAQQRDRAAREEFVKRWAKSVRRLGA